MLCTFWADTTSLFEPARTTNRSPFFRRLAPNVLITSCTLCLSLSSLRPVGCSPRQVVSTTSSCTSKPDSTSESGYSGWIHAILLLRFCSVKRPCANAQHPAVAHLIDQAQVVDVESE